jgi:hypothetical protein
MKRVVWFAFVLASVLAVGIPHASAQVSGSINGTITDNTGAVLPGVTVTATSPALMGPQIAVSNNEGVYRFPTLPPGSYRLNYELGGFGTVVRDPIVVQVGFTATVSVQMQVASLQETVTVSGASPVVDVQNTNIQNNFTAEVLSTIPSARDLWSVIGLSPGITVERFDVGGSRAGTQTGYQSYGTSDQVRVMADGANLTEDTGGAPYADFGAFEEIQLGTASNDASMPTPGLMINTVIKSGGNEVKGQMYFDYENENLQARNVSDELRRLGVGEGSRITKYWDPNFNMGGPFKRDKLWYFFSLRGQRIGTTVTGFPIEAPGTFEFVTRLTSVTEKVSYQLNQNNKLSQWMQFRRKEQPHRSASSNFYLDAVYKQDSISPYGGADWHSVVTPTFFFNARFGTWGYNWSNFAYGNNLAFNDDFNYRRTERVSPSIERGSAYQDRNYRRRWQGDFAGTLFRDGWAGGDHTIKIGYTSEWEIVKNADDGYLDEVRLRFDSPANAHFSVPWRVSLYNTPTLARSSMWHHGAYINDQVNLSRKVTLNAGIRWDYYRGYVPDQSIGASRYRDFFYAGRPLANGYSVPASFSDFRAPGLEVYNYNAAFGPRVGIAYDVLGDGKNVVKASWGRFYHNPGPDRAADYNPVRNLNFTFRWNDLNGDRLFTDNELGAFVSSSGSSRDFVDPDIGHPWTDDMSVFFERELVANMGARVGFVYKKVNNDYENIEVARVAGLYTDRRPFGDPGPDGVSGTSDDGPTAILFDIPAGAIPASVNRLETPDENWSSYKNVEFMLTKRMTNRWSLMIAAHHLWADDSLYGKPENPNEAAYNRYNFTNWAFKIVGTYEAPFGISVTPLVRHQSGDPLQRVLDLELRSGDFEYTAEGFGKYRVDNPTIVDTRVEKRFSLPGQRLGLFFDAFNLTNSNSAESMDDVTGRRTTRLDGVPVEYAQFMRPTAILNPRIYRFGVKYDF